MVAAEEVSDGSDDRSEDAHRLLILLLRMAEARKGGLRWSVMGLI